MRPLSAAPGGDPREIVRHFTPNWFAATMGTGILALMLAAFPYGHWGQMELARALWFVNVCFFALFSALFLGRALFCWSSFVKLFEHPVQSLFIGAIPMGFATIVNGLLLLWPISPATVAWAQVLWWVDVALAVVCVLLIPFFMFTAHEHSIERMTAAWLLPIVPPEVSAASGGLLAQHLTGAAARTVVFVSYALWSVSVLLALAVLAILLLRLILHKLPHRDMAVSAWLPLGPLGTGALAMLTLGKADALAFAPAPWAAFGQLAGVFVALVLWGFGLWWLAMAAAFTLRYLREGLPFNMGWWGFTFPLGVFDAATYALAEATDFPPFTHLGAALTLLLAGFWLVVTQRSFVGMWTGALFRAPCLSEETGLPNPSSQDKPQMPKRPDLMTSLRQGNGC